MIKYILGILLFSAMLLRAPMADAQACSAQDVEAWKRQADNDYDLDNYEAAIHGYTCMIEISDEQDAYAYLWRGVSQRLQGELSDARSDIIQAIELDPSWGYAYYSLGDLYLDLNNYQAAIESYSSAINNGYRSSGVYNNRGYAYDQLGDTEQAKLDFLTTISIDDAYGLGYSNLGDMLFLEGDIEGALENFEVAIDYSNGIERAYPYRNRGTIHYMNQDHRVAIDDFTTAIEIAPDVEGFYLRRAEAYRALNSSNAYADYLRYIQLIQTEIVDLEQTNLNQTFEMTAGRVYRQTYNVTQVGWRWKFSAKTVIDGEVDTLIVLLGPSGTPVAGDDDSGTDKDAAIRYQITEEGTYTLLVTHSAGGDTGEFILSRDVIANQLAIGQRAEVFAVDNAGPGVLNMREYPSLGFEILERLPSGSQVNVINGPYSDRDFVWWQVETDAGQRGWVAEHIGGIQTLFPAIYVGRTVAVSVTELNLRSEPDAESARVDVLLNSSELSVIGGPVEAGGFTWWQLRYSDDVEGWAVEWVNDRRTLVGVVEN